LVNGVGSAVGPVIGGIAMSRWQHGLGYMIVVAQALIIAWGSYRMTREAPRKHKGTFMVEPVVPVSTTLEPARLG
jgi:hypothetical protein